MFRLAQVDILHMAETTLPHDIRAAELPQIMVLPVAVASVRHHAAVPSHRAPEAAPSAVPARHHPPAVEVLAAAAVAVLSVLAVAAAEAAVSENKM